VLLREKEREREKEKKREQTNKNMMIYGYIRGQRKVSTASP